MAFGLSLRKDPQLPADYAQHPATYWDRKAEGHRVKSLNAANSRQRQYHTEKMILARDAAALIRKG